MTLSIVIVTYNAVEVLEKCLLNLADGCWELNREWEVVLVDNGSEDNIKDQISKIKNSNERLKIFKTYNKENLGFSKAVNQGIEKSRGKFVLLLNPDVVCQKGAITKLVNFALEKNDVGVVGGGLLDPDGKRQASVFHFPSIRGAFREFWLGQSGAFSKYLPESFNPVVVEAVVGAVMLIPKKVIEKVGFLDERYFMYFEDLDYCRRIKNTGLEVFYNPQAKFIHYHGQSGKKISTKVKSYLTQSSKTYSGLFRHYLINGIIWAGQKWQFFLGSQKE